MQLIITYYTNLHIVIPSTLDNDPLHVVGSGEAGELQQPLQGQALVHLGNLGTIRLLSDDVIYNLDVKANEGTTSFEEYNVQIINQPLFLQAGFSYDIIIK